MSRSAGAARAVAESYYDSPDADGFYRIVWGGEDIHIGLYQREDEDIATASRRTVERMALLLDESPHGLGPQTRVLDIGAGYGGAARHLAATRRAHVKCLNLSRVENERNAALTEEAGLSDRIAVRHGSFEDIPAEAASFDVVWSQDAILHAGDRARVLAEVARVLKPGGSFVFTDPMQADGLDDPSALEPIYARLQLQSLASIGFYREGLARLGFEEALVLPLTGQLACHYRRVGEELARARPRLRGRVSEAYIDRMLTGLAHWVEGARAGHLEWAILHFVRG
ncbi:MAG: methyltransferase domain-containing protein [Alphaproteobacteria bacterium]|nr:methyltransferase domain-containing protein [Alphaproteobacteria bacterium]